MTKIRLNSFCQEPKRLREKGVAMPFRDITQREGQRMKQIIAGVIITLSIFGGTATGASAAKVKDCGTTVTETGPGNSGFTQTETETQTAACNSNSDTGEVTTTGPVTNRGGGTPGGQQ